MIYALPGMGADSAMYPQPWPTLPGITLVEWPAYAGEESIAAVARRIIETERIPEDAILIGSSFGGFVACEIAKHRRLRRLVLVGSAIRKEEINGLLRFLHPLARVAPIKATQRFLGRLTGDIPRMLSRNEAAFVRAMCRATFEWPGLEQGLIEPLRLHGRRDLLIPPSADADLLVDGRHMIAMTNAAECVEFIKASLAGSA